MNCPTLGTCTHPEECYAAKECRHDPDPEFTDYHRDSQGRWSRVGDSPAARVFDALDQQAAMRAFDLRQVRNGVFPHRPGAGVVKLDGV